MKKILINDFGKSGIEFRKDGEKNQLVIMKENGVFWINIGNNRTAQGITLSEEELLDLADEIKILVKSFPIQKS
jgi:hypothetical protein